MPATDQQLRAIAFLAANCRPYGARQWDEAGIYAKVAEVRDRSLGSIVIAAIQAAEDRNAITPGVIPKAGPHWRTPEAAPVTTADRIEPSEHCAGCGKEQNACETRRLADDDHEFVSVAAARSLKRDPDVTAEIRDALKAELRPMRTAPDAEVARIAAEVVKKRGGLMDRLAQHENPVTTEETA